MLQLKSLKHKVALFIILPLCLLLLIAGTVGMRLIGRVLLDQWEETAISKMEKSAHQVDMRLMRPKEILTFFQQNREYQQSQFDIDLLTYQLKNIEGVIEVHYTSPPLTKANQHSMTGTHKLQSTSISSLNYNAELNSQTVSIIAEVANASGTVDSTIEVVVAFYDLIDQIVKAPWWKGNKAFILAQDGNILTSTALASPSIVTPSAEPKFFQDSAPLQAATWKAIKIKKSGTFFPGRHPLPW